MIEVNMSQVEALENQISDNKTLIKKHEMLQRLLKNRDFKELILKEFMVEEAAIYVQNSANPALDEQGRADCLALAQASGHLKRWMVVLQQKAVVAMRELDSLEQEIVYARAEEDETVVGEG